MIFAAVGTSTYQFKRFVKEIDLLAKSTDSEVYLQIGYTIEDVKYCKVINHLSHSDFLNMLSDCTTFISHTGIGVTLDAMRLNKPLISIPRSPNLNEHTDDHQLELATALKQNNRCHVIFPDARLMPEDLGKAFCKPEGGYAGVFVEKICKLVNDYC